MSMPVVRQSDAADAPPSAGRSPRKGEACLATAQHQPFAASSAVEGPGMTRGGHSRMCRIDSCRADACVALVQARTQPVGTAAMRGAGLRPTEVTLHSGSDADEVVELLGVGAAALDLFGEATEQGHVIQTRGRLPDVHASHAGESAGDIDDVDTTATGTLDLASLRHGSAPFLPFRTVAGAVRTCLPPSGPDPVPRDRDSTWRP